MGRGRAKAKQTKVARELKYNTGGTDLERLQAELQNGGPFSRPESGRAPATDEADEDGEPDDLAEDDEDEDYGYASSR